MDVIRGAVRGPVADRDTWQAPDTRVVQHEGRVAAATGTLHPAHPADRRATSPSTSGCAAATASGNGTGYLGASVDPHGPIPHEPGNGDPWADTWFYSNPVFVDVVG